MFVCCKSLKDSDGEDSKSGNSDDDSSDESSSESSSSSDDEHQWKQSVKDQYKQIQDEKRAKRAMDKSAAAKQSTAVTNNGKQPKFFELKDGLEYFKTSSETSKNVIRSEKLKKLPLSSRVAIEERANETTNGKDTTMVFRSDSFGNKQMTFVSRREKREKDAQKRALEHHLERKGIRRSAGKIVKTLQKPKFFGKKNK